MTRLHLLLASTLALQLGCRDVESPGAVCLDYAAAGINVRVRDSVSGAWAASGAQLSISMLGYSDSASFPANRPDLDSLSLAGAYERAGVFQLRVRKAGYSDWVKANVQVASGECHVIPALLTARIVPSS